MVNRRSVALEPSAAWLAELRRRVTEATPMVVARRAKLSRTAVWYAVAKGQRRASLATLVKIVDTLNRLTPDAPMPPPYLVVDGPGSDTWKLASRR